MEFQVGERKRLLKRGEKAGDRREERERQTKQKGLKIHQRGVVKTYKWDSTLLSLSSSLPIFSFHT